MKKIFLFVCLILFPLYSYAVDSLQESPDITLSAYKGLSVNSPKSIEKYSKTEGPLKNWLLLQKAQLFIDKSDWAQANLTLDEVPENTLFDFYKQVLSSQVALGLNQARKTLRLLENLPPAPALDLNENQKFYRTLYQKAYQTKIAALNKVGKKGKNESIFVWSYFPDLENPTQKTIPGGAKVEDKITRLIHAHEYELYEHAASLVTPADIKQAKISSKEKCDAFYRLGDSLRRQKNYALALASYQNVPKEQCDEIPLVRSLFWKSRMESQLKDYAAAIRTNEDFIRRFPNHQYTDDAYYSLWSLHKALNDKGKAKKAYKTLLDLKKGDMKTREVFRVAFSHYKKQDYKQAIKYLDDILSSVSLGDESHPQAAYWKARCIEQLSPKNKAEARNLYKKIINQYPFSFYALMASVRGGLEWKSPHFKELPSITPTDPIAQEALGAVDALISLGETDHAQDLLDYFTHLYPKNAQAIPNLIAQKWMDSGDYNQSLKLGAEHFDSSAYNIEFNDDDPMVGLLYPMAFPKAVEEGYKFSGLLKGAIEGIMREESMFHPKIQSHAGATGLMQLMPATAQIEARKINVESSQALLNTPEHNILLGSSFFKRMVDRYNGKVALAVMAYNAGPGNVDKWLKTIGNLPVDEFIESVPFSETKGYVKRVLRSMLIYGSRYGEDHTPETFLSMKPFKTQVQ